MPVYDFSSGLNLLNQGISTLGDALGNRTDAQAYAQIGNALANNDYRTAAGLAWQAGKPDLALKLQMYTMRPQDYPQPDGSGAQGTQGTPGVPGATGAKLDASTSGAPTAPPKAGPGQMVGSQPLYGNSMIDTPSGPISMPALKASVASIESAGSGGYSARGPDVGGGRGQAIGKYQVMPENVGPWTQEVLGYRMTPEQFAASPEAQERVFEAKAAQYLQNGGLQGFRQGWFGTGKRDITGTTGDKYQEMLEARYGRNLAALGQGMPATGSLPSPGQGTPQGQAFNPSATGAPDSTVATSATGGTVAPGQKPPPQATAAPGSPVTPPTKSGNPSDMTDVRQLVGFTAIRNGDQLKQFMSAHGITIDPANLNWCAGLVQAHLQNLGIQGPKAPSTIPGVGGVGTQPTPASYGGQDMRASSFLNWGTPVQPGQVQANDVLVRADSRPGQGAASPRGHVGMATGNTRMGPNGLELEMISGNVGGAVAQQWVPASQYVVRRGQPGSYTPPGQVGAGGAVGPAGVPGAAGARPQLGNLINPAGGPNTGAVSPAGQGALDAISQQFQQATRPGANGPYPDESQRGFAAAARPAAPPPLPPNPAAAVVPPGRDITAGANPPPFATPQGRDGQDVAAPAPPGVPTRQQTPQGDVAKDVPVEHSPAAVPAKLQPKSASNAPVPPKAPAGRQQLPPGVVGYLPSGEPIYAGDPQANIPRELKGTAAANQAEAAGTAGPAPPPGVGMANRLAPGAIPPQFMQPPGLAPPGTTPAALPPGGPPPGQGAPGPAGPGQGAPPPGGGAGPLQSLLGSLGGFGAGLLNLGSMTPPGGVPGLASPAQRMGYGAPAPIPGQPGFPGVGGPPAGPVGGGVGAPGPGGAVGAPGPVGAPEAVPTAAPGQAAPGQPQAPQVPTDPLELEIAQKRNYAQRLRNYAAANALMYPENAKAAESQANSLDNDIRDLEKAREERTTKAGEISTQTESESYKKRVDALNTSYTQLTGATGVNSILDNINAMEKDLPGAIVGKGTAQDLWTHVISTLAPYDPRLAAMAGDTAKLSQRATIELAQMGSQLFPHLTRNEFKALQDGTLDLATHPGAIYDMLELSRKRALGLAEEHNKSVDRTSEAYPQFDKGGAMKKMLTVDVNPDLAKAPITAEEAIGNYGNPGGKPGSSAKNPAIVKNTPDLQKLPPNTYWQSDGSDGQPIHAGRTPGPAQ